MTCLISELDYKKELELEQQRQMIQRQLKELDSQEAVHVRGHENFTIEKKIMSRVSEIDKILVSDFKILKLANVKMTLTT